MSGHYFLGNKFYFGVNIDDETGERNTYMN